MKKVSSLEEELHYLHESGYAREFPVVGVYEETFIWEKGTVENDINIKLSNNYGLY